MGFLIMLVALILTITEPESDSTWENWKYLVYGFLLAILVEGIL